MTIAQRVICSEYPTHDIDDNDLVWVSLSVASYIVQ